MYAMIPSGIENMLLTSIALLLLISNGEARQDEMFDILNKNASHIIRMRGFMAEEHEIVVEGGYILNLVKATNPLINEGLRGSANRSVVFFLHGTLTSPNWYTIHSSGASPMDYSLLDATMMSTPELLEVLEENNSKNSLVLTLLNFGHEVWFLNRRGNIYSQGNIYRHKQAHMGRINRSESLANKHLIRAQRAIEKLSWKSLAGHKYAHIFEALPKPIINLSMMKMIPNPRYWDFTIDDTVQHDIPAAIEYVLEQTGRKRLAFVGHSTGGALALQALSVHPGLNNKFTKLILWSPALNLNADKHTNIILSLLKFIEGPARMMRCDLPNEVMEPLFESILGILCSKGRLKGTCRAFLDAVMGPGSEQNLIVAGSFSIFPEVVPSLELAQLAQYSRQYKSTMYDYGPSLNKLKYGQSQPPVYNLSAITTHKMTIYRSEFDTLVPQAAVERAMEDIVVPFESILINEANYYKGLKFNHHAFGLHKNITPILVEPCLRAIQEAGIE